MEAFVKFELEDIFDHIYDIDSIEVTFGEFDPMTGNYISWLDGGRNAGIIIEPNVNTRDQ